MSELKAGVIATPHNEGMSFHRGSDVIAVTELETEFYLKSEADKVIAEKDKEIQRLENLCESYRIDCDNLAIREANAYREIERDNKQIRHQKYKRCLAQVENCRTSSVYFFHLCEREKDEGKAAEYRRVSDWFDKWEERWLELAERFKDKEAK